MDLAKYQRRGGGWYPEDWLEQKIFSPLIMSELPYTYNAPTTTDTATEGHINNVLIHMSKNA